jgi:hypothetical protein
LSDLISIVIFFCGVSAKAFPKPVIDFIISSYSV